MEGVEHLPVEIGAVITSYSIHYTKLYEVTGTDAGTEDTMGSMDEADTTADTSFKGN